MGAVTALTRHSGPPRSGEPGIHNHDVLGSIDGPVVMGPGLRTACGPGTTARSIALRRMWGRIITRHLGHTVAGINRDGRGAGRRFHPEPLLMHLRNRTI